MVHVRVAPTAPVSAAQPSTFAELGVCRELVVACDAMGWKAPTTIQAEAIPHALQGRDLIGLAQMGSGKTGTFALPIIQALLDHRKSFFALVLPPTRELAIQIREQFKALGSCIGLVRSVLVGGVDRMKQVISLAKRPHIVVATPGRLLDHLKDTKGFSLKNLKYLILDEADQLLDVQFEKTFDDIINVISKERITFLFSATMTTKVAKLKRAHLGDPVTVSDRRNPDMDKVASKYSAVDSLRQEFYFVPVHYKDKRLGALNRFKTKDYDILVCTDVVSRGLDIQGVDVVINYEISMNPKDYVHWVGRTARTGLSGYAVALVNVNEALYFKLIEQFLGKEIKKRMVDEVEILISDDVPWISCLRKKKVEIVILPERVSDAKRMALRKENESDDFKKRRRADDDDEEQADDRAPVWRKSKKPFKRPTRKG